MARKRDVFATPDRDLAHAIAGCWVCEPDGRAMWTEGLDAQKMIQNAIDHHKKTGHACWADVTYHEYWGERPF